MGFTDKINQNKKKAERIEHARADAPEFERVKWLSNSGLRRLYWHVAILSVASATTGFDG